MKGNPIMRMITGLLLGACFFSQPSWAEMPLSAEIELLNSKGEIIGTASLLEMSNGVKVSLRASGLPPGQHGIHFHEKGACTPPKFESAGAHLSNPGKQHGLENPKGPHAGDLPNLTVESDGTVVTEFTTSRVTLKNTQNSLLKNGGTSLVIHAQPDDQVTDPSGNSGDRIACGVVREP